MTGFVPQAVGSTAKPLLPDPRSQSGGPLPSGRDVIEAALDRTVPLKRSEVSHWRG